MRKTNVLRILLIFLLLSFCSVEISFAQKKKKEPAKPDCNALFSVYAYNKKDSCINNSKGFFIDTTGTGITLIGVFKGATSIKIITSDSSVFEVDRITGVDETGGIVRFSIKNPESRMFYFFKTVDYKVDSNDKVFAFKNKVLDEGVLTKVKLIPQYGNLMFCNFNKRFLQNGEAVFNKVYQLIGIANESLLGDSSNIFVIDIERIKKFKTIRRANSLQDDISRIFFNNYFLKGLIAVDNSHVDTAIACFSKAIENYSRDPEVYLQRAELYVLKNEYKKAIMDYTSVLERDTKNDNAYYGIGNCYFNMHMFNEGFDSYSRAIELNPKNKEAYKMRAETKFELGSFNDAVSDCNEAIKIDINYGAAYLLRGVSKSFINDKSGACKDINKAADLNTPNAAEMYEQMCK